MAKRSVHDFVTYFDTRVTYWYQYRGDTGVRVVWRWEIVCHWFVRYLCDRGCIDVRVMSLCTCLFNHFLRLYFQIIHKRLPGESKSGYWCTWIFLFCLKNAAVLCPTFQRAVRHTWMKYFFNITCFVSLERFSHFFTLCESDVRLLFFNISKCILSFHCLIWFRNLVFQQNIFSYTIILRHSLCHLGVWYRSIHGTSHTNRLLTVTIPFLGL